MGNKLKSELVPVHLEIDTNLPLDKYLLSINKKELSANIEKFKKDIEAQKKAILDNENYLAGMIEKEREMILELTA